MPRQVVLIFGMGLCILLGICDYAEAQPMQFRGYSDANGLYSNTISVLHQDRQGFLWIGTPKSLQRYDGNTFKRYNRSERSRLPDR